jgi:hypothetical protein
MATVVMPLARAMLPVRDRLEAMKAQVQRIMHPELVKSKRVACQTPVFEVAKEVETEMPPPAFPTISTKLIVDAAAEAMLPFNWIPKDVRVKMAHFPSKQDIEMGRHSKLLPEASLLKTITRYHLERQKSFVMNSTQKKVRRASCC